ncbi:MULTISPECIES: hypothetical protein [unclassified Caballeronia]|uniref:hypothetical protein n=1 Tax=unclassified Caballeronia TaxID=2646786 RepID=UPI002862CF56|nr:MULTISPECIES: hypothetical protein [unclassified Caballeronia]MDR5752364.1 hypothetical protein [Caballeronia sp. LZ024]MDR5845169.1 hypothetical protein [Caballeronia sp. LZ031]
MIDLVRATLARGAATGDLRADVDALEAKLKAVRLATPAANMQSASLDLRLSHRLDDRRFGVVSHVTLAAMGYCPVSNRFTLKVFVGRDSSPEVTAAADA